MAERQEAKRAWVAWLAEYGADRFFDAFLRTAQDAEGRCVHCHAPIFLDIVEGGGVPDWRTTDGDYGCDASPDTNSEGAGSHNPTKLGGTR